MPHIFTAFWLESGTKQQTNTEQPLGAMAAGNLAAGAGSLCETGTPGSNGDTGNSPVGPAAPGRRLTQNTPRTAFKNYLLIQIHL